MMRAMETAIGGFVSRSEAIDRLAVKVRDQAEGDGMAANLVGLIVNQHAAEANLVVARVAEQTTDSLIHIIA
jgi:hypothetical protein